MTAPTPDAVAQAREAALAFWVEGGLSGMEKRVDALIAAVRAECAADTKRLDWLESQHGIVAPVANLVVKRRYDANSSDWCDVFNNVRQTIDEAMEAHP